MAAIPYAFSAHHFISSVGADAGFAAIIGLAILVILFFAQARETATLRQRAAESDEHLRRLAAYVEQLSRAGGAAGGVGAAGAAGAAGAGAGGVAGTAAGQPRVVAQPRIAAARTGTGAPVLSAPVAAGTSPPSVARPLAPAAPAGVGAPALSAATRLIPMPEADSIFAGSAVPAGAPGAAGAVGADTGAAVMAPPAPSTAAGGANGSGTGRPPAAAPPPAGRVTTSGGQPAPRVALRRNDAPARPPVPPSRRPTAQDTGGSRISRGVIAAATVLLVAIVAAVLLVVTNSGGSSSQSSSSSAVSAATAKAPSSGNADRTAAAVTPAKVNVAVLNGTSTSNLAHDVMQKLVASRYKQGTIATASNQTLTSTIVGFLPGYKPDALAVARSLKLGPASVQAVNQSDRAVACAGAATCSADVVVTVGSDLASEAPATGASNAPATGQ